MTRLAALLLTLAVLYAVTRRKPVAALPNFPETYADDDWLGEWPAVWWPSLVP